MPKFQMRMMESQIKMKNVMIKILMTMTDAQIMKLILATLAIHSLVDLSASPHVEMASSLGMKSVILYWILTV